MGYVLQYVVKGILYHLIVALCPVICYLLGTTIEYHTPGILQLSNAANKDEFRWNPRFHS